MVTQLVNGGQRQVMSSVMGKLSSSNQSVSLADKTVGLVVNQEVIQSVADNEIGS